MSSFLKIERVYSGYGDVKVLRDISIDVEEGELAVIIGANGAGKSTLLKTICGQVNPSEGKITFKNETVSGLKVEQIVEKGIVYCPEGRRVFPEMTVKDNLLVGGYLKQKKEMFENLNLIFNMFPRLKEREGQMAGCLSGGEQQMLAIGRSLMSSPSVVLFDEPSLGLAPVIVKQVFKTIESIRERGVTIVLVEQNANLALEIADKGYVVENGEIVLTGTGKELLHNGDVKKAYLGV